MRIIHKHDWIEGWRGAGRIAFHFTVPRGKSGKSQMVLLIEPEMILKLAEMMRATGCTVPATCAHAVYHLQHHDLPVPCSSCMTVPTASTASVEQRSARLRGMVAGMGLSKEVDALVEATREETRRELLEEITRKSRGRDPGADLVFSRVRDLAATTET